MHNNHRTGNLDKPHALSRDTTMQHGTRHTSYSAMDDMVKTESSCGGPMTPKQDATDPKIIPQSGTNKVVAWLKHGEFKEHSGGRSNTQRSRASSGNKAKATASAPRASAGAKRRGDDSLEDDDNGNDGGRNHRRTRARPGQVLSERFGCPFAKHKPKDNHACWEKTFDCGRANSDIM
jgi:hypothetical protein